MNPYRTQGRRDDYPGQAERARRSRWLGETTAFALAAFASLAGSVLIAEGCKPPTVAATAAESAYTADLLRCVDEAETLSESRACRTKVDARWGITEVVTKDGGR